MKDLKLYKPVFSSMRIVSEKLKEKLKTITEEKQ